MQPFSPSLQIPLIHVYCPQPDFLCKSRKSKAGTVVPVYKDDAGTQYYMLVKDVAVNTNFTNTTGGDWQ